MTDEEYNRLENEIFAEYGIPEEFHPALAYYAYQGGHSAGHEEILNDLRELCCELKDPFQQFIKKYKNE